MMEKDNYVDITLFKAIIVFCMTDIILQIIPTFGVNVENIQTECEEYST